VAFARSKVRQAWLACIFAYVILWRNGMRLATHDG